MKTINSKKLNADNVELFIESNNRLLGFAGKVQLYDSEIFVDTRTGKGYEEVIEKLKPLVYKLAQKFHFNGNSFEDTRHDIIVHILEGIPKYDPRKNAKLSTFIEMRVNRRLINELRNKSRISKNATFLNVGSYSITCDCGCSFNAKISDSEVGKCVDCSKSLKDAKKIPVNTPEINESLLSPDDMYDYNGECIIGGASSRIDDSAIFMHDMANWLRDEDPRVVKVIELIYFHDYSIKAAAEEVGLSGAGANMKLKELSKNDRVREVFGR